MLMYYYVRIIRLRLLEARSSASSGQAWFEPVFGLQALPFLSCFTYAEKGHGTPWDTLLIPGPTDSILGKLAEADKGKQVFLEDSDLDGKVAWLLGQQLSVAEVHSQGREVPLRDARCAGVLNNRLQHPAQVDSDERSSPPQPPGAHPW
ncbi:unnamed protein product [Rangifer tarandus platyrhynchus]|uniref:Uncharacterized protein n=2 Tax=Rangifer tarandus platyrhynchus TaxID=3082113 RepID=A0ABN8YL92_RANTA|nr:unnamed protein product [Rangifer tarandus platyrhynchus]CAI9696774.1 unnamed protein product [Rangifer tarandus platyrhynchus]